MESRLRLLRNDASCLSCFAHFTDRRYTASSLSWRVMLPRDICGCENRSFIDKSKWSTESHFEADRITQWIRPGLHRKQAKQILRPAVRKGRLPSKVPLFQAARIRPQRNERDAIQHALIQSISPIFRSRMPRNGDFQRLTRINSRSTPRRNR